MNVLYFVLYLLAAVCFGLASFGVVARRVNFLALGLLLFTLVPLIHAGDRL